MDESRDLELPPELDAMARRLEEERPSLSGLELDHIKLQVKRRADRPKNTFLARQRRTLVKSRMAITSMLVLGVLSGGTGAGLAVSGVSDDGSAGKAQYPAAVAPQGNNDGGERPDVLGREEVDDTGVAGTRERGSQGAPEGGGQGGVQAGRQVGIQEDGNLPFTGLAAIPLILVGIGLLATGVVLNRRLPESA